jgi:hypothetical protein
MIDILLIAGFGAFLASADMAERTAPIEYWLPLMFGAVVILAYAGLADVAAVMVAKP